MIEEVTDDLFVLASLLSLLTGGRVYLILLLTTLLPAEKGST